MTKRHISFSDYTQVGASADRKEYSLSNETLNSIPKRSRNGIPKSIRVFYPTDETAKKELDKNVAEAIVAAMEKKIRG